MLQNMATQGRPIVTVSVALFARDDAVLGQLAATASIDEDVLTVAVLAPHSYDHFQHVESLHGVRKAADMLLLLLLAALLFCPCLLSASASLVEGL